MITIYSALFGPYDILHPTIYNSTLFTDQKITGDGWHIEQVEKPHEDDRKAARYYFDQSHLIDSEYTIMHGANAILKVHPSDMIKYLGDCDWACCAHPRGNVYDEAKAVIRMRKDKSEIVNPQMDRYRSEGFSGNDLSALIIVVRRNTDRLKEFEQALWQEVKENSHRDQLAFDYMRWKMDFPIARLPDHWNNYIELYRHNRKK